jgi:hypothetical protein
MWLLFEAGLLFSRIINRKPPENADPDSTGNTT